MKFWADICWWSAFWAMLDVLRLGWAGEAEAAALFTFALFVAAGTWTDRRVGAGP